MKGRYTPSSRRCYPPHVSPPLPLPSISSSPGRLHSRWVTGAGAELSLCPSTQAMMHLQHADHQIKPVAKGPNPAQLHQPWTLGTAPLHRAAGHRGSRQQQNLGQCRLETASTFIEDASVSHKAGGYAAKLQPQSRTGKWAAAVPSAAVSGAGEAPGQPSPRPKWHVARAVALLGPAGLCDRLCRRRPQHQLT